MVERRQGGKASAGEMDGQESETDRAIGVGMILLKPDAVLMVKRGKQPFLGRWSYPGGIVEHGESPLQAALRELFEETGLDASDARMVGRHTVERALPPGGTLTLHVFTGRWQGGEPVAADDAAEARFIGFGEVADLDTTPQAALWLERARALGD